MRPTGGGIFIKGEGLGIFLFTLVMTVIQRRAEKWRKRKGC